MTRTAVSQSLDAADCRDAFAQARVDRAVLLADLAILGQLKRIRRAFREELEAAALKRVGERA